MRIDQVEVSAKPIWIGGTVIALLLLIYTMIGVNYNGYRTVIQTGSGSTSVKFTSGPYLTWFGHTEVYPDVITFDFDRNKNRDGERSIEQQGINVRFQEGGTGTVYGQARFTLPTDEATMLQLHRSYRSAEGVSYKLIKPSTEEVQTLTANLMTSDESYMEKRSMFIEWSRDQIQNGKYRTTLQQKETKEEGTDKTVYKNVPVIALGTDGLASHTQTDMKQFGVVLSSYQLTDWDYEAKTIEQITKRREASMAIITAKADAERAKQDAITAEQNGLKNVTVAKYEKEVEKQKAVVDAERAKEVAEIDAKQKVAVAGQKKLEEEQNKLAMAEFKQAKILEGEGEASYKRAVLEADGALAQKLKTYENVMERFAAEFGKQKWVPDIQFGANPGGASGNEASKLIEMLSVKAAKDLSLDLETKTPAITKK